jgi:hypothetical protein
MSQVSTLTLLPQTDFTQLNKTILTGEKVPGVGYTLSGKNLQTLTWKVKNLQALVRVQATLEENPQEKDWFVAHTIDCRNTPLSQTYFHNLEGSFVWLRLNFTLATAGKVEYFKVTY